MFATDPSTQRYRQLHKFGGSSLATPNHYRNVAELLSQQSQPDDLLVVSASGKTTNHLIEWFEAQSDTAHACAEKIREHQISLISGLITDSQVREALCHAFLQEWQRIAMRLNGPHDEVLYADVVGHGERWSARLMAALLEQMDMPAVWLDARSFLKAPRFAQPQIDAARSRELLQPLLAQHKGKRLVVTGFIASNQENETVLLGRNGSDYSATQVGALAQVHTVTIWSDVAGVFSADPRLVKDACLLPLLRLDEASELARLAAPVLHARTLQPVMESHLNLQLKSSYHPQEGSTRIERVLASGLGAKIVTSHSDIGLVEITVHRQAIFSQVLHQLQSALVIGQITPLISHMSADRCLIQLAYTREVLTFAKKSIDALGLPAEITERTGFSLLAAVGAGVTHCALHYHRFYQLIKDQPVEFVWESEQQISLAALLRTQQTEPLVIGLHHALFSPEKRVGVVLLGRGQLGHRWLELMINEHQQLSQRTGFDFVLAGGVDKTKMWLDYAGLDASDLLSNFERQTIPKEEANLNQWLQHHPFDDLVIVDTTSSPDVVNYYEGFARYGFHIVSANTLVGAASMETYRNIRDAFSKTGRHWLYSATLGGGLPVNYALRDLRNCGDKILGISGIFSQALSWIFAHFDGSVSFSQLVEQAWLRDLFNDDPRKALSGQEVAETLMMMIREAGYAIEAEDIRIENLLPAELLDCSLDQFWQRLPKINAALEERRQAARVLNLVLRYTARFSDNGKVKIGIDALPEESTLAMHLPGETLFLIESRWYRDGPLVIKGSAGRDALAGALLSDLYSLAKLI